MSLPLPSEPTAEDIPQVPSSDTLAAGWNYTSLALPAACPAHSLDTTLFPTSQEHVAALVDQLEGLTWRIWLGVAPIFWDKMEYTQVVTLAKAHGTLHSPDAMGIYQVTDAMGWEVQEKEWQKLMEVDADSHEKLFVLCLSVALDLWESRCRKDGNVPCFHLPLPSDPLPEEVYYSPPISNSAEDSLAYSLYLRQGAIIGSSFSSLFQLHSHCFRSMRTPTDPTIKQSINAFKLLELIARDREDPFPAFFLSLARSLVASKVERDVTEIFGAIEKIEAERRTARRENEERKAKKVKAAGEGEPSALEMRKVVLAAMLQAGQDRMQNLKDEVNKIIALMMEVTENDKSIREELEMLATVPNELVEDARDAEAAPAKVVPWRIPVEQEQVQGTLVEDLIETVRQHLRPTTLPLPAAATSTNPLPAFNSPLPRNGLDSGLDSGISTPRSRFETAPPSVTTASDANSHEFIQGSSKDHVSSFYGTAPKLTFSSAKGKGKELPCTCGPRRGGTTRRKAVSSTAPSAADLRQMYSRVDLNHEVASHLVGSPVYLPYVCLADSHTPRYDLIEHNSTLLAQTPRPTYEVMTIPNLELDDALLDLWDMIFKVSLIEVYTQQLVTLLEHQGPPIFVQIWAGRGFAVSDDKLVFADDSARTRMRGAGKAMVDAAATPAFQTRVAILAGRVAFSKLVKALTPTSPSRSEAKPYCLCYLATEISTIIDPAQHEFNEQHYHSPVFACRDASIAFQRNFLRLSGSPQVPWSSAMGAAFQHWLRTFKNKWINFDPLYQTTAVDYRKLFAIAGGAEAYSMARKHVEAINAFEPEEHRPLWRLETHFCENSFSELQVGVPGADRVALASYYLRIALERQSEHDWLNVMRCADSAILIQPGYHEHYMLRSRARINLSPNSVYQLRQALLDASVALSLRPGDVDITFWRAQVYIRLEKWAEAASDLGECDTVIFGADASAEFTDKGRRLVQHVAYQREQERLRASQVVKITPWSGTSGQLPPWLRPGASSPPDAPLPAYSQPFFGVYPTMPWGCSTPDCRPRSNDDEDAGYAGLYTEVCDADDTRVLGGLLENLYTAVLTFSIREYHIENSLKLWQELVLLGISAGFLAAKKEGLLESARSTPEAYFVKFGAEHFRESFKIACAGNKPEPVTIQEATEEFHLSAKEFVDKLATMSPFHLCLCLLTRAQSFVEIQTLVMEYEKVAIMPEATLSSSLLQVDWDAYISRLVVELDLTLDDDGIKMLRDEAFLAAVSLIHSTGTDLDHCDGMLAYPDLAEFVRSLGGIRIFTAACGCQDCSEACIVRDFEGWATVYVEGLSAERAVLYEDMGDHYFATGYDFEQAVDMYSIALTYSFNARLLFRRCLASSASLVMEAVQARSGTPPLWSPADMKRREEILRVNIRNLTIAIGLEPGLAALYTHRATALHALGFHVQAYNDLEESFSLDPSQAPVQLLAIDILARQEYRPSSRARFEQHVCILERCFEGPSSTPVFQDGPYVVGTDHERLDVKAVHAQFVAPNPDPLPTPLPPKLCYPDPRSACPPHRCTGTTPDVSNFDTLSALLQRAFTLAMTLALAKERPELLAGRQAATLLDFLRYAPWDSWNVAKPDGQMRILRRAAKEVATSFGTGRDSCRAAYGLEAFTVACGMVLEAISTPEVRNPCFCYLSCHLDILSSGIRKLYALAKKLPTEPSRHHKLDVTRFFAHCDLLDKRGVLKFASWERNVKISFVANTIEDCFKQLLADMETTGTKSLRERRALDLPFEQHYSNLVDYVGGYGALEHAYRLVEQGEQPDFPSTSAFLAGIGESQAVDLMLKPGGADWSRFSVDGVIMRTPQDVSGWAAFIARTPIDADFQPNRQHAIDFFHLGVTHMAAAKNDAAIRELSIAALWAVGQEDDLIAAIYLALAACRNFIGTLLHRKEAVADATLGLGHSDDAMLLVCRADALISLGRFPEARKDLELALKVDPDCVAAPEWAKFIDKIPTTLGRSKSGPSRAEQQQMWTASLSEQFPRESEFAMCGSLAFLSTNFINSSAAVLAYIAENGTTSPAIDSPSSPEDSRPGSPLLPSSITELLPSSTATPAVREALERLATLPSRAADPIYAESEDSLRPVSGTSLVPTSKSDPTAHPSTHELEALGLLPPKNSHSRPPRPRSLSNRPADLSFSVCPPELHDPSTTPDYSLRPQVEALLTSIFEATHEVEWRKSQPSKMIEFRERCISAIIHGGQDWEKIPVDSAAYKVRAKDVVKASIVAEMDPSKSAAYGLHAWEDGVDKALELMDLESRCICTMLSLDSIVMLKDVLAQLSSPPPPKPLRLPPIDVAGLIAQFRNSIKDGRLSGGIWRSGPKWKSKVTSLIALFSTHFSDIIAELEAAGEIGRFDQVWPELARVQGGGRTLAMGMVASIEGTCMNAVKYAWSSWLAYIATTRNGYDEGGLAAREALAERRRIMGIELSQTGRELEAIAELRLSLLLDPYNVQTYSDIGDLRYSVTGEDYLTSYENIAESTIGLALTTGKDRIPFLENRLLAWHALKDMEETEDAADKDRAEIREIKASLLPRDEPIRTNGGTVTEL